MLGATHKYTRRLIFFGKSAEQNGEKIMEIDWTVFAQSLCAQQYKIGDFSDFAAISASARKPDRHEASSPALPLHDIDRYSYAYIIVDRITELYVALDDVW